ncbi:hypothetical protein ACFE04_029506 [Oxalis oulophora]
MSPPSILRLLIPTTKHSKFLRLLNHRQFTSTSTPPAPSPSPNPNQIHRSQSKTPLETQFDTWVHRLRPGFTPCDVVAAIQAQSDPDLALDIFRWTAQQRSYKHDCHTYMSMIKSLVKGKRYRQAETLIEEVIAGACNMSVPLYNLVIRFCCGRRFLFNRALDVYKKMLNSDDCKPTLETYTLLFNALLSRFHKLNVCYVYLHAVKSLNKQMRALGVIPDTFVLNMIIKAYAKCLDVDEAIRVFREMGLYGCEPNNYTYSYIVKGFCEKGKVGQGFKWYKDVKKKGIVLGGSTYMVLICSLALDRNYEDAIMVVSDMLGNNMGPDFLTYKTVLEGLCRDGRCDEAFDLLEEWRNRDKLMGPKNYKMLLNGLHINQD